MNCSKCAELKVEAKLYRETSMKLSDRVLQLESALELIAAPRRPDGTYNRSREVCEQLAHIALSSKACQLSLCNSGNNPTESRKEE
jgi:hypothetical protein